MDVKKAVKSKENYGSIVAYYKNLKELDVAQLATLIDIIEEMSKEIFEHFKALCDIAKEQIKRIANEGEAVGGVAQLLHPAELTIFGNIVEKACNMDILLREKYEYLYNMSNR